MKETKIYRNGELVFHTNDDRDGYSPVMENYPKKAPKVVGYRFGFIDPKDGSAEKIISPKDPIELVIQHGMGGFNYTWSGKFTCLPATLAGKLLLQTVGEFEVVQRDYTPPKKEAPVKAPEPVVEPVEVKVEESVEPPPEPVVEETPEPVVEEAPPAPKPVPKKRVRKPRKKATPKTTEASDGETSTV